MKERLTGAIILNGEIPSPSNPPSGCRFRTRCPIAIERCAQEEPAFREIVPSHFVACHRAEESTTLMAAQIASGGITSAIPAAV